MFNKLATLVLLALPVALAEAPLPELRVEPADGGSVFFVRNVSSQPLTAYLIELVDYPGSAYSLWEDELVTGPLAPGSEKRIQVVNMTVGAVPDYVKMRAAIYADGSTGGIPEKVTQFVERRRFTLQTARELITRIEKGKASKPALKSDLDQWAESMKPQGKNGRNTKAAINQAAGRALIADTAERLEKDSIDGVLDSLKALERALAASKPD